MTAFRVTQISDTHLSRRFPQFVDNFHRVADHIDTHRPDLVINTGDLAFDGPGQPGDLEFAKAQHAALPVSCRFIPGNHDIGDNPTRTGTPPAQQASDANRQAYSALFGEDRWRLDAAGWCLIGLNSLIMNTSLGCETEQFDWLAAQLSGLDRPLALFIHKPLYRDQPDDEELAATSFRYVPVPARGRLLDLLGAVDLRLVSCGHVHQRRDYSWRGTRHVWAPSTSFIIRANDKQELIGIKEVGLVDYTFQPDGFEVRHLRAPGQIDLDLHAVIEAGASPHGRSKSP